MALWRTKPVTQQPKLTMQNWLVHELPDGSRHLIGYCPESSEGRVTSAVVSLAPLTLEAMTQSGHAYVLSGPPGLNLDALYVWKTWMTTNKVTNFTNLSGKVYEDHLLAKAKARAKSAQAAK